MKDKKTVFFIAVILVSIMLNIGITTGIVRQNKEEFAGVQQRLEAMEAQSAEPFGPPEPPMMNKTTWRTAAEQLWITSLMQEPKFSADPLTAVAEKVIAREIVEDTYFNYVKDAGLVGKIEQYNEATQQLRPSLELYAIGAVEGCFGMEIGAIDYGDTAVEINYLIKQIAKYSMYRNSAELIQADTELAQMLQTEPAKSNEHWQDFIYNQTNIENAGVSIDGFSDSKIEYFDLVDSIIEQLYHNTEVIKKKVLAREVVEDSYLCLVSDENLVGKINKYNELTSKYRFYFTNQGVGIVYGFFELWTSGIQYFNRPVEVKILASRIAKHALYRNVVELVYNDWYLSPMIVQEWGGSAGVWPHHLHNEGFTLSQYDMTKQDLEEYFILVDTIIKEL